MKNSIRLLTKRQYLHDFLRVQILIKFDGNLISRHLFYIFILLFFRYKGRIIYNTRYQESCGSSTNNLNSGNNSSTGLGAASGGVSSAGASGSAASRETRRSSRFRSSGVAESAAVHGTRSSSSGKTCFLEMNYFEKLFYDFLFKGRGHRSSINGSGGRTKSSKSRRERGEDRGTPYDSASSSNIHRGSRRHRNHHSSSGNSSSIMGGNVSSKLSKFS